MTIIMTIMLEMTITILIHEEQRLSHTLFAAIAIVKQQSTRLIFHSVLSSNHHMNNVSRRGALKRRQRRRSIQDLNSTHAHSERRKKERKREREREREKERLLRARESDIRPSERGKESGSFEREVSFRKRERTQEGKRKIERETGSCSFQKSPGRMREHGESL